MNCRASLAIFFAIAAVTISHAALEFSGYLKSKDGLRFVVTDLEAKQASTWLKIGDTFQGHKVAEFDSENEILTLDHAGVAVRLPLKDSHVKEGKLEAVKKQEIPLAVGSDGALSLNGKTLTLEAFKEMLLKFAETGTPIDVALHEPPDPNQKTFETGNKIVEIISKSGVKKYSLHIVDAPRSK